MKATTRGQKNWQWIEKFCRVPEGAAKDIGKPVRLRPWQKDLIEKIYDNPHGTRRAIASFGRKNGKTALSAFLLLLHLCGREKIPNSQLFSAAQSREQASLLFGLAAKCARLSPELSSVVTVRDTAKQLFCPMLGTLYRALSAEASTAYGLAPVFIVHDELGQVKGARSPLYEALETATGTAANPLSIIISTQAPTDSDLLSVLIDDALAGHDPRVVVSLHTAPLEDDPFDEETIRKANPAYGDFLNPKEVLAMAEDARRMPQRLAEFRNLVLNQRVEASAPFVERSTWLACGAPPKPLDRVPVFAGLDLSEVSDLTALVMIGKIDNVWHVHPTFWIPGDGLDARSRRDRAPYDLWARQGFLEAVPGKTVDYEYVARHLRTMCTKYNIKKIAFDPWNFRHLRPWLVVAGFNEKQIDQTFAEFGQGYKSMSPAMRVFSSEMLNARMAHGDHPVLAFCAANAVVAQDTMHNKKLVKNKSSGRIDGMVALAMAFGVASETHERVPTYQIRVI